MNESINQSWIGKIVDVKTIFEYLELVLRIQKKE